MSIVYLGKYLAKKVFQFWGLNQSGKPGYTKQAEQKLLLQAIYEDRRIFGRFRSVHRGTLLTA